MPEKRDLSELYTSLNLTEEAIAVAEFIRENSPSRNVQGSASNVAGLTTMRQNGTNMPFESRTDEYYFYVEREVDDTTIEVYPQPPPRKINYTRVDGKNIGSWKCHDAFVFRSDGIGWVECKHQSNLLKIEAVAPDLMCRDEHGVWTSPACSRDANSLGFTFDVFCPNRCDVTFVRNADFLFNYLWQDVPPQNMEEQPAIVRYLKNCKCTKLSDLLSQFSPDAVFFAIAQRAIFFDWYNSLLCRPEVTEIFATQRYRNMLDSANRPLNPQWQELNALRTGDTVAWEGEQWTIAHVSSDKASLVNSDSRLLSIAVADLKHLFSIGELRATPQQSDVVGDRATEFLKSVSPAALAAAFDRKDRFDVAKSGENSNLSDRTARDWAAKLIEAEGLYGIPVLGLVHRNAQKGNRAPKADPIAKSLAIASVIDDYEQAHKPKAKFVYGRYAVTCKKRGVSPVSFTTYNDLLNNRDKLKQEAARDGKNAAYQSAGPLIDVDLSTPPNGDRAWEIATIDHTPVDLETISEINNDPLGKPWLTYMIDAYSRLILAMWLTFYPPSRISIMMVMRDCVRRWGRLPDKLVVDRGADFKSIYFDLLLSKARIKKFLRPPRQPRHGSVPERVFGTTDTNFTHNLIGNTQHSKLFRSRSASHNPKDLAIWTPDALEEELEHWSFETYPRIENAGIAEEPLRRFERSIATSGARDFSAISYDDNFLFATMPEPQGRSTRKVSKGTFSVDKTPYRGLNEHLTPFNGEIGPVRIEPLNPSVSWIQLQNQWRQGTCTNDLMREYVERAIKCSQMEISARLRNAKRSYRNLNPKLLGLIERLGERESELIAQKKERSERMAESVSRSQQTEPVELRPIQDMPITSSIGD